MKGSRLLVFGFLALMLLPFPLWLLLRGGLDTTNYENRSGVSFPVLSAENIAQFPQQFEAWLGDAAPFRNQMMALNSALNRTVGTLNSEDVLLGEDGWLFLKDVADSSSLSDYQGLTSYSEQQLADITAQINELQSILSAHGTQLVITFAPAKEGVYAQYMPSYIPVVGQTTRVQQLCQSVAANSNVPIIFAQQSLIDAAQQAQVYYKYDTHWNEVGAWVATQEIFAAIGFEYAEELPQVSINEAMPYPQDLANISASWEVAGDDHYYTVNPPTAELLHESEGGNITVYEGSGEHSLLFVRDSFGQSMAPILAQAFGESVAIHGNNLTAENLAGFAAEPPSYIIIEVAERYSDTLQSKLATLIDYYSGV